MIIYYNHLIIQSCFHLVKPAYICRLLQSRPYNPYGSGLYGLSLTPILRMTEIRQCHQSVSKIIQK